MSHIHFIADFNDTFTKVANAAVKSENSTYT